jgi:hypothetical protein
MATNKSSPPAAIGFLTVVKHEPHGWFGGYLLLNLVGRPLEFHCTAPVKPNRAQEILYGHTLEPYLFGEQIGHTLISKAQNTASVVLTDVAPALAVRDHISQPVALVLPDDPPPRETLTGDPNRQDTVGPNDSDRKHRPDGPQRPALAVVRVGHRQLGVPTSSAFDPAEIVQRLAAAESIDLFEPFARIRDAIEEAQRGPK